MNESGRSSFGIILTIVVAIAIGLVLVFGFIYWDKNKTTNSVANNTTSETGTNTDGIIEVPSEVAKIQDAVEMAKEGDTVKIAAGTYKDSTLFNGLSSGLRIDKAITVEGAGRGKTIIDGKEKGMYGIFVAEGTKGKVTVKDMTIQNFENNGVNVLSKLVEISGMTISGSGNQGAYFKTSTHDSKFHNNIVIDSHFDGVHGDKSGIQVYNNTIVGNGTGISFVLTDTDIKATSPEMFNNIFVNNGDYGILYGYPAYPKDAIVDHNDIFGNGTTAYFQYKNNEHTKSGKAKPTPGTGELAIDPNFVDEMSYKLPTGSKLLTASRTGSEVGAYGK